MADLTHPNFLIGGCWRFARFLNASDELVAAEAIQSRCCLRTDPVRPCAKRMTYSMYPKPSLKIIGARMFMFIAGFDSSGL